MYLSATILGMIPVLIISDLNSFIDKAETKSVLGHPFHKFDGGLTNPIIMQRVTGWGWSQSRRLKCEHVTSPFPDSGLHQLPTI